MNRISFRHRGYRVISYLEESPARKLTDAVVENGVTRQRVFRDNWRTLSAQIEFERNSLLLKVPRARNHRRWERLLSLVRGSDALRTFRHLEVASEMGFSVPVPVLAAEQRSCGGVVDSFLCYRFVSGRPATEADAGKILATLRALHQRGYTRGDAQLANFLVVDDKVTLIDFRLKKPRFLPRLQKAREVDRFLRSCPEARKSLSRDEINSLWLRLASQLEAASFGFRNLKRWIRKRGKMKH